MKTSLKGSLYVFTGAVSYGILATIVKYANQMGIHTGVLTFMQFFIGLIFLALFTKVRKNRNQPNQKISPAPKLKLMAFGLSLGFTSSLYYLSIQYIPVSLGIILLMQSIWMSIILESVVTGQKISSIKIIATITVIIGTLLATNILFQHSVVNWKGIFIGLAAGFSYTVSMYASSSIENKIPNYIRSKYLVSGGLIAIILFWNVDIIKHFDTINILWWGAILAIFGTIIPPLLFTKGIPLTGIGMGSIIASIEIPVSILAAHFVLGERVSLIQWVGVLVIIGSVVLANRRFNTRGKLYPQNKYHKTIKKDMSPISSGSSDTNFASQKLN